MPSPGAGQIRNFDCLALIKYIDPFMVEVKESVSSSLSDFRPADKIRLQSYINAITGWIDYSSKQPPMDKPHSHPLLHNIPEAPVVIGADGNDMDNIAAQAVIHELATFRINVQMSQSSDLPNGYQVQDLTRFRSYVVQLQSLLNDFIDKVLPLDLPETSRQGI